MRFLRAFQRFEQESVQPPQLPRCQQLIATSEAWIRLFSGAVLVFFHSDNVTGGLQKP